MSKKRGWFIYKHDTDEYVTYCEICSEPVDAVFIAVAEDNDAETIMGHDECVRQVASDNGVIIKTDWTPRMCVSKKSALYTMRGPGQWSEFYRVSDIIKG